MNCRRAQVLISLVIDGEATQQQRRLLDFHLMGCPACRRNLEMSQDISRMTRILTAPIPPENLEDNIRQLIESNADKEPRARKWRSAVLTIPAAAAILLIMITALPISPSNEDMQDPATASLAVSQPKNSQVQVSSKTGVRTAPLSEYSRQASLISFLGIMTQILLALLLSAFPVSVTNYVYTLRASSSSGDTILCSAVAVSPRNAVSLCIFSPSDSVCLETTSGMISPDSVVVSPDLGIVLLSFSSDVFEEFSEPSSEIPELGDRVTIVGQGLGGSISVTGRTIDQYPDGSILVSAELREGLMGAAVFSKEGSYLGMITGIVTVPGHFPDTDLNEFLVLYPSQIWYMWSKLAMMEREPPNCPFGITARSSISLSSSSLYGIQIVSVINGSRAWDCGLRPGDLVTEIDGTPVYHPETLRGLLVLSDDTLHAIVHRGEFSREILIPPLI